MNVSRFQVRSRIFVLVASVFMLAAALWAQEKSPEDLTNISIEDLARLQVYSASRHLENSEEAPSAVSIITAEEIKSYGWRTLAEALRSVRGFYTAYDRDYVYLGVRGVLQPGNYNSRILLLINGHRVNDNVYDSAHIGTEFPLDLDLVERIEIVRGPSSSLFGTNAVFGIINVITRKANRESSIEVATEASSWMGRSGRLTASFQRGRLTGLLSGSASKSNGQEDLYFPEFESTGARGAVAHNKDGDSFHHEFADLQLGRFRLQGLFSDRTKHVPTAPLGTEFNTDTTSRDRRMYFDAGYHRPLSSLTDLDVRGYYDDYLSYAQGTFAGNAYVPETHGAWQGSAQWSGFEATVARQYRNVRITVGEQYEYSFHVRQKTQAEAAPPVVDEDDPQKLVGTYGQAEVRLTSRLTVNAGLRYDWFSTYAGSVSPRVALVYALNGKTSVKYIFGRAFRAPNAYENWYDDGITRERPVPTLRPERIQSQDFVLERRITPGLAFTAEFFCNSLSDLIDQKVDSATGRLVFRNAGMDKSRGVGAELRYLRAGSEVRVSYLFSDAMQVDGSALANDPAHSVKVNGSVPAGILRAGVEVLFSSSQRTSQGMAIGQSLLSNLTVSTKPFWRGMILSASCYNCANQGWYSPPAVYETTIRSIRQDGRSFRLHLAYRFVVSGERATHD